MKKSYTFHELALLIIKDVGLESGANVRLDISSDEKIFIFDIKPRHKTKQEINKK